MQYRKSVVIVLGAILVFGFSVAAFGQGTVEGTPAQRVSIMRSRLESMRRSLNSALASMNAKDNGDKDKNTDPDDPRNRLRSLEQDVNSTLKEVDDISGKIERNDKFDSSNLDKLEASVTDLNTRVQSGLQATAGQRNVSTTATSPTPNASVPGRDKKKKGKFLGIFGGGGGDNKYAELTDTVAPGRDRQLFEIAAHEVRKGNYDEGRFLFNTIITTYPDSPFLPLSKLAIADSFYLEGTTSSLIQAAQNYQDWITFFPTHPLTDRAMLKVAESEIRQMGLPDREIPHALKAEQRLKAILQQFPNTTLRETIMAYLNAVQDNLAQHDFEVARFYQQRYMHGEGGLKGAQMRYREIIEKYKNSCVMDASLFNEGWLYLQEEEPDEAAKFFTQLVRDYPNSDFADKAKDELSKIGVPIPEPDPIKKNLQPCEKQGMMQSLLTQISGSANISTNHDGVLISHDSKAVNDLIDVAIANQGQLPSNVV
ncbi:MAG TPA: outer membrane protein assembly factor BamD, partial [Pyrinomonadaceae bacterium]|nr:outer membrane protein assembly factor BamD [Pyrinomonadaceae bacterium]